MRIGDWKSDVCSSDLPTSSWFPLLWLSLNISYVMEFFMQSLVKKGYLLQGRMLQLQVLLMSCSLCAAFPIVLNVHLGIAMLSLLVNLVHRGHDFFNTA